MKNVKLSTLLAYALSEITVDELKANEDSKVFEANRSKFMALNADLINNSVYVERILNKTINALSSQKKDRVIIQACIDRSLPALDDQESGNVSAQVIYNLNRVGILKMYRKTVSFKSYFTVGLGKKFPAKNVDVKRLAKRIARKNKRIAAKEPSSKVSRNNSRGLYSFNNDDSPHFTKAVRKMQSQQLRLYIPGHIDPEWIAEHVFKHPKGDPLYDEVVSELVEYNGKTFYTTYSGCRILRMYSSRYLSMSAPSDFRPFLRLPRKRRLTASGYRSLMAYLDKQRDDLPEWYIAEIESLNVGDYTNVMVEVDGNNQGPSIVAALMRDQEWFQHYWDSDDGIKMYESFKDSLLKHLGVDSDLLVSKDVKYKIMTKPYNKSDRSNVFGDEAFRIGLAEAKLAGLFLRKYEFFELPLKVQLQHKLGDDYAFDDEYLLECYKRAVDDVAPFLEQFQQFMHELQRAIPAKPSIYYWFAADGDLCQSARSENAQIKYQFYDAGGRLHSFTYEYTKLVDNGANGGETSLSPSFIASIDAWIARELIMWVDHDIWSNHDAFFVHPNDVEVTIVKYKELFAQIPEYGDKWLSEFIDTYKPKGFNVSSFAQAVGQNRLLSAEGILASTNLVGF